jgi:hypothetical protein
MPTFRQRFTGPVEEDFPEPPIARRLQPSDVVEYEAAEPIEHARLEVTTDEPPTGWDRLALDWPGAAVVYRAPASPEAPAEPPVNPRTRKSAATPSASTAQEE